MSETSPKNKEMIMRFSKLMKRMNIAIILFILASIWFIAGAPNLFFLNNKKLSSDSEKEMSLVSDQYEYPFKIDEESGLILDKYVELVKDNCTSCHSAKLITYTSADSTQWHEMIIWMQQTQGLWDLGSNEKSIIEYLSKHYGATNRQNQSQDIINIWYEID
jgi:hypothetical protein